jgi:ubiquinone/menaquinone biosynthesis C-methylase UbiE
MTGYYDEKLCGNRLKRCYEIAPLRIKQYLDAEIQYVTRRTPRGCRLLELGCGYGRVLQHFTKIAGSITGIDISQASIYLAAQILTGVPNLSLYVMDALKLGFRDNTFERVLCIQNGISAFNVDQRHLIEESIRVTKNRGLIFYSSYSKKIWPERLHWFELQAAVGLIGDIDGQATREGVIICKDGFTARTIDRKEFLDLMVDLPGEVNIEEVDGSSLFCVLTVCKNI